LTDFAGSYRHESYGTLTIDVRGDAVYYKWGALNGRAEVLDARICGWFGCRYYNALLIDAGGGTAVDFEFLESGPATGVKMLDEKWPRVR